MKNILWILSIVSIFALTGCSSDNESNDQDCFTCTDEDGNETTYCYNGEWDSYWYQINDEKPRVLPLRPYQSWEDFKATYSDCESDVPTPDCFECTENGVSTMYCYTSGDQFYTSTTGGVSTEIQLNGESWDIVKTGLQDDCNTVPGPDCFDCVIDDVTTTYCYTEGDDFYSSIVDGETTQVPLDGATWDTVKNTLQQSCDEVIVSDCFDCEVDGVTTTYCYTAGNDFYTSTVDGESTEMPLGTVSWVQVKTNILSSCENLPTEDCFDCTINGVAGTYCYTEGDDFYTLTVDGTETQLSLNGLTWAQVKGALQTQCE